jgi:hypothetical protein
VGLLINVKDEINDRNLTKKKIKTQEGVKKASQIITKYNKNSNRIMNSINNKREFNKAEMCDEELKRYDDQGLYDQRP